MKTLKILIFRVRIHEKTIWSIWIEYRLEPNEVAKRSKKAKKTIADQLAAQMIAFFLASVDMRCVPCGCQHIEMTDELERKHLIFGELEKKILFKREYKGELKKSYLCSLSTFSTRAVAVFQIITEPSADPALTYWWSTSGLNMALDQS